MTEKEQKYLLDMRIAINEINNFLGENRDFWCGCPLFFAVLSLNNQYILV